MRWPAFAIAQQRYGEPRPSEACISAYKPDLKAQRIRPSGPKLLKRRDGLNAVIIRSDLLEHQATDFFPWISDDVGEFHIAAENVALRRGVNDPHRSLLKESPTF
jgi:hypothetical protein